MQWCCLENVRHLTMMEQPKRIDAHMESEDEDLGKDWLKINRNVKIDGFRTGMEASHEQMLQSGFNAGFTEALQMSLAGGQLQGVLCAHLSYPARPVSEQTSATCVQGKSSSSHICTQLHSLLSSNIDLISSIPSLLQGKLMKDVSQQPTTSVVQPDLSVVQPYWSVVRPDWSERNAHLSFGKTDTAGQHLEMIPGSRESRQCTSIERVTGTNESKGSEAATLSCEHVCSSKSHFWSQLQHFTVEAQTLGVVTSDN